MNWNQILSTKRLGQEDRPAEAHEHKRTQFQRDYDRLIFSSPFRRMQNKTQVFPLPGSIFVHNRLTHSLEVASVGRSLGNMLSEKLQQKQAIDPLMLEIGSVVSAACLAHDMGNPPFGHSGEDAISEFFNSGTGKSLQGDLSEAEWKDFTLFDGNANAFRILSHQFKGRRPGGFALTYTMLASIVKYPFESVYASKPKFGFFQSEKENYYRIAEELGIQRSVDDNRKFVRHPLVFLVEAADDICYQVMDLEDAHKLKILSFDETRSLFLNFYDREADKKRIESVERTLALVDDQNEQIAYLRAGVIGMLAEKCVQIFEQKQDDIFSGSFQKSLMGQLEGAAGKAMKEIQKLSVPKIYKDPSVIAIEISGYQIIGTLLEEFTGATLNPGSGYSKRLLSLIPEQYHSDRPDVYSKIQSVLDFVSGMTDLYALDIFRKIKGINLPSV
ncbi:MAG: dehydrogenase [Bacteroidetes bacterium GWF2_42_66]|nr:MAG: dehydrogenase [Bacteroidetes bacterium GWA2_42_15]OFY01938.1 MAG: dehydrogenase [Bacteroidetes bacterium GWE2_42_39]OFY44766.1 MAG: dehydrogenase [Bacteroidetes bacterium GWF2_42_66]HBL75890.1 deoxyguanosinetriphosphate triphosphohydrolase [Prolixibacteraceae bacterium]HCR89135.1 deoxyguanosinetriphosphate triphosphohydrolase [Prolixibacteraceae bacterium]